jgi:hypothetical protein
MQSGSGVDTLRNVTGCDIMAKNIIMAGLRASMLLTAGVFVLPRPGAMEGALTCGLANVWRMSRSTVVASGVETKM